MKWWLLFVVFFCCVFSIQAQEWEVTFQPLEASFVAETIIPATDEDCYLSLRHQQTWPGQSKTRTI
ncbi:MAG: hypothetical protein AAFV80_21785, partial [Bacteroidota bacterium]